MKPSDYQNFGLLNLQIINICASCVNVNSRQPTWCRQLIQLHMGLSCTMANQRTIKLTPIMRRVTHKCALFPL